MVVTSMSANGATSPLTMAIGEGRLNTIAAVRLAGQTPPSASGSPRGRGPGFYLQSQIELTLLATSL
jgi:hypothetical protein